MVDVVAELSWLRCPSGRVAAVTGTKGKSTTTAALGAMLKETGADVRVGGNIGQAVTGLVEGSTAETVFVLEVSSFQLEGTEAFHPRVAVFLNLSPDHLDRHPSFDDYAQAKARIFRNQTAEDWAVVNADDPAVLALARAGRAPLLPFHPRVGGRAPDGQGGPPSSPEERRACAAAVRSRASSLPPSTSPGASRGDSGGSRGPARRGRGGGPRGEVQRRRARPGARGRDRRGGVLQRPAPPTPRRRRARGLPGRSVIMGGRYKGGDFGDLRPGLRMWRRVLAIGGSAAEDRGRAWDPARRCLREPGRGVAECGRRKPGTPSARARVLVVRHVADYAERGRAFAEVRSLQERRGTRMAKSFLRATLFAVTVLGLGLVMA